MEEQNQPQSQGPTRGQKVREGIQHLEERAQQFKERASEKAQQVRERVSAYQAGANEFLDSMAVYIRENPQRAALIAAGMGVGVGIILGMLMRGRRD